MPPLSVSEMSAAEELWCYELALLAWLRVREALPAKELAESELRPTAEEELWW